MPEANRDSGIEIVGTIPWGTHFCLFYQDKEDLIDILVPYFKAGLQNNEYCMWVTSEPLMQLDAAASLLQAVPDLHSYIQRGQIEFTPYSEFYLKDGYFNSQRVLNAWLDKVKLATVRGFDGLRLTGNTFWLEKNGWRDFLKYEDDVNEAIGKYRMLALCAYSLPGCSAVEIIDVVNTHQFALVRREGKWAIFESSERKRLLEERRTLTR